jgi:uncharacterized protein YndB with AHSA1/START domain
MTEPDLVRLFVPSGWAWAQCEMDVRVGGKFRRTWNAPDGRLALSIRGEHRKVNPRARIVHT